MRACAREQVAALLVVVLCSAPGCFSRTPPQGASGNPPPIPQGPPTAAPVDPERLQAQVKTFCGDCHGFAPPSSFAKKDWEREVHRGFKFYRESGRLDLPEPLETDVVAYFEGLAPDKLTFDPPVMAQHPLPLRYRRQSMEISSGDGRSAVSWIGWTPSSGSERGELMFADMHVGEVSRVVLGENLRHDSLGNVGHPACVEAADLDSDGQTDYLVADLGSFLPEDHDRGRVVWLHPDGNGGFEQTVLADNVGRVAQAVAGDFDRDGDTDVLAAVFGWIRTGNILLLRRVGDEEGVPRFEPEIVDPRHGTSHVRPIDWEGDGDLDFVALISQEYEHVELFVNDGSGKFSPELIYAADDPTFGSSGIELVDLDADGDMDVLHTNGDSMDSADLKPFHAVRWLENGGSLPFTEHVLSPLPGAYKALAVDFDADRDLDVITLSFPPAGKPPPPSIVSFDELVVLEQTSPGQFARHSLDAPTGGAALAAGDFDGDGDLDLAQGSFSENRRDGWLSLWWNEGRASSDARAAARDAAN